VKWKKIKENGCKAILEMKQERIIIINGYSSPPSLLVLYSSPFSPFPLSPPSPFFPIPPSSFVFTYFFSFKNKKETCEEKALQDTKEDILTQGTYST
jgi:hypothetical protein